MKISCFVASLTSISVLVTILPGNYTYASDPLTSDEIGKCFPTEKIFKNTKVFPPFDVKPLSGTATLGLNQHRASVLAGSVHHPDIKGRVANVLAGSVHHPDINTAAAAVVAGSVHHPDIKGRVANVLAGSVHHPDINTAAAAVVAGSVHHPDIKDRVANVLAGSVHHPDINTAAATSVVGGVYHPNKEVAVESVGYSFSNEELTNLIAKKQPFIIHHGIENTNVSDQYISTFLGYEALTIAKVGTSKLPSEISISELTNVVNKGPDSGNFNILVHGRDINYKNVKFIGQSAGLDFSLWDDVTFPQSYDDLILATKDEPDGTYVLGLRPEDIESSGNLAFVNLMNTEGKEVRALGPISMLLRKDIIPQSKEWEFLKIYWETVEQRILNDRKSNVPLVQFVGCGGLFPNSPFLINKSILSDIDADKDLKIINDPFKNLKLNK